MIIPLILLIFIDTFATIFWFTNYGVEEANPVMAHFLNKDVFYFFIAKMMFSFPGIFIIRRFYNKKICKIGLFVLYLSYIGVFIIHCGIFMSLIL
jgi:hypothetical protein